MHFRDIQNEDRRLAALQVLEDSQGFRCNAHLLREMLSRLGHDISIDRMLTDISWLLEQGLAESEDVGGIVIVTLTERGHDAAAGRGIYAGVRRPRPGER